MREPNPFAPPMTTDTSLAPGGSDGMWVEDDVLIVPREGAVLPPYCAKCGQPTDGRWQAKLQWNPRWVPLTILICWPAFLIAMLATRKTANISVGLCEEHQGRRRNGQVLLGVSMVVMLLSVFAGPAMDQPLVLLGGIGLGLVGIIIGAVMSVVLQPVKMDDTSARLKRAHPELLNAVSSQAQY